MVLGAARKTLFQTWFAVEAIPIYAVVVGAVGGAGWYCTRLATRPDIIWDRRNNPTPWMSVEQGMQTKLHSVNQKFDKTQTVKRNQQQYDLPLKILSYDELYGWTMDRIVEQVGRKNNCTFCGVFRRQALDRGAAQLGVDHIVTGHNADDIAETVLMNIMRGDIARLGRCTQITTQSEDTIKRSKPFKYAYEKEIVLYAHFKKLDYFSTECIYSPDAYRGHARAFLKDLEAARPSAIVDIIHSGEAFELKEEVKIVAKAQQTCLRCGYISSNDLCKACMMLEGLERGLPKLAIKDRRNKEFEGPMPENARTIPTFERNPTINNNETSKNNTANTANKPSDVSL
ncbi:unnamed protein product [Rhizoctonia solani]|uniref:Cytoplasmic tRNA 2-thiolation protein 1 n=1 Tax=Rhizoctonia solani TaxID=456999 RepID=A0A8H3B2Z9_9AGAM|nr:unnamed protein product [Rhizoctonia solani]CAE6505177.1 unnamed protein product [Rhizoctonia solani]